MPAPVDVAFATRIRSFCFVVSDHADSAAPLSLRNELCSFSARSLHSTTCGSKHYVTPPFGGTPIDTSIPFQMGDGNGMQYLRRQRSRVKDIVAGQLLPFALDSWEQRKTDDMLFTEMIKDVFARAGIPEPKNRREWNTAKQNLKFNGRHLYSLGFWNVLSSYLSSEGYLYLQDLNGYDSNTMNWNVGEAFQGANRRLWREHRILHFSGRIRRAGTRHSRSFYEGWRQNMEEQRTGHLLPGAAQRRQISQAAIL